MGQNLAELVKPKELGAVRNAKLKEIMKAWDDLFFILAGEDVFKKMPGISDYSSFEKRMRQSLEKNLIAAPATVPPPSDLLKQVEELLSVDYVPPQSGEDILADLMGLAAYYHSNFFSPSVEMTLDLSLCKLIGAVNRMYGATKSRGETILTGRKRQMEEVASSQRLVAQAFHELKITNKPRYTSKRRIAQDIREHLLSNKDISVEEQKKIPSEKTIIRYMESDEKIRGELIKMGVIKDKPTLV